MAITEAQIEAEFAKSEATRKVPEPWWADTAKQALLNIGIQKEKVKLYTDKKLSDQGDSLATLLQVIDNEEAMNQFNRNLYQFKADSSGFADHTLKADTLNLLGQQKKEMFVNFSESIQETSDFINTTQFLDKADEFINIQDTINRVNKELKAENKREHGSVADFLHSELANANRLHDNMAGGFKMHQGEVVGTNFRYNKAETSDKEAFRQLKLYRDRLDLAVKSLAGDKKISAEEAEAIIIGSEDHYFATKNAALRKAETNFKYNRNKVVQWSGFEQTAIQNKIKAKAGDTDFDALKIDDVAEDTDSDTYKKLSILNKIQDWDGLITLISREKGEYMQLRNAANLNYKNWYGSDYEKIEGGMTEEESKEHMENLEKQQAAEKLLEEEQLAKEKLAEEAKLEETKQRYVEPVEEKKVQTYDVDKKNDAESLLTSYVGGNISDAVLQNIGGQSLLNRARVLKNAYKGQKPKATVIPFVSTEGTTPVDIESLKDTDFKIPGKAVGRYKWEDVVSEIHSKGAKLTKNIEDYLSGKIHIPVTWKWRRGRAWDIQYKFAKSKLSVDEFREKYPEDYKYIADIVASPGGKPYRWK